MTPDPRGDRSPNRAAADWIARLNADDRTRADEAAFRRWLAANPDNANRFERLTDLWEIAPGSAPERTPLVSRRRAMAGLATLAAAGVAGTVGFQAAYAGTRYETGIGEQRQVALEDGSALLLDADTSVRVAASPAQRRLWLARGRVGLTIAPLPAAFTMEVGSGSLSADAGRFDLRRDPGDRLSLIALEGGAQVHAGGVSRTLASGERLRATGGTGLVDRPDPAATEAWKSGRAAFHDDTLARVADEANRYSRTRLLIADPATAALRISGIYRMGDNLALGRALATLLALRLRAVDGAVLLDHP